MIGRVITGKFKILQQIDSGGMGSVYKADDSDLGRTVAVKKISAELAGDAEAVERFRREAQAIARAAQQNSSVATIYQFVMDQGEPFLVMEYVEGVDLHELIGERALPLNVAAPLIYAILLAFGEVHKQQLVHRDIKPKNVIVSFAGEPKIIDFGIARMTNRAGVTQYGQTLGTPVYMSPEQVMGETLDGRSDLYSLAVMLFEMLAGRPPFPEDGEIPPQKAHLTSPPPALPASVKGLPAKLDAILARGLAKKPEKRFQSAEAFAEEFRAALPPGLCTDKAPVKEYVAKFRKKSTGAGTAAGAGVAPPPTEYAAGASGETRYEVEASPRRSKPRWLWWAVAGGVLVAVMAVGGAIVWNQRAHPKAAPAPVTVESKPAQATEPSAGPEPPVVGGAAPVPAAAAEPAKTGPLKVDAAPKTAVHDTAATPPPVQTQPAQPKAVKTQPLDPAEKRRIEALKALGEYKEEKKDK